MKNFLAIRLRLASRIRIVFKGFDFTSVRAFRVALVQHKIWRYTLSYVSWLKVHEVICCEGKEYVEETRHFYLNKWADPVESLDETGIEYIKELHTISNNDKYTFVRER